MNRKMKSVGMWLLLGSLSTGMAYADLSKNESEIDIVQQTGICQGIVKDATGESVIGASVIHSCPEKFYHSVSCLGPLPSGTLAVRSV